MIRTLTSWGGGFQERLPIAPEPQPGVNWFTVFIAQNGGRKSFLLRCLAEAALGNESFSPSRGTTVHLEPLRLLPTRVIAISGTPLDRFPRAGTTDLRSKRRRARAHMNFVYLGPRASNGMAGLAQSERSLVGSLISNRHLLKERAVSLRHVFGHLGLETKVEVFLQASLSASKNDLGTESERDVVDIEKELSLEEGQLTPENDQLRTAVQLWKSKAGQEKALQAMSQLRGRRTPTLLITAEGVRPRGGLSVAMWELLMRLGHVVVSSTRFSRKNNQQVSGDQLSSGQWGWLEHSARSLQRLGLERLFWSTSPRTVFTLAGSAAS